MNKKCSQITLNLSSNVTNESNDETNVPHNLFLTNAQVARTRKAFYKWFFS